MKIHFHRVKDVKGYTISVAQGSCQAFVTHLSSELKHARWSEVARVCQLLRVRVLGSQPTADSVDSERLIRSSITGRKTT